MTEEKHECECGGECECHGEGGECKCHEEGEECTCGSECSCHNEENKECDDCECDDEHCKCAGEHCECEENAEEESEEESESEEEIKEETTEEKVEEVAEAPKKPAKKVKKETKKEVQPEGKGKVIVITSGKGGVGKTTTSANIGTALAKLGNKIVVIDTDIGLRNLDLLLGLENRIVYTIVDVVEKRCKLKQALVKDKANPNLCLLAAAQTRDKSALNAEQLLEICADLKRDFDYVLIDCPAGIEQGFQNAVAGASEAIIVTTPEMSAVRDADRIIGLLESKEDVKNYKLLVNRVRPNMIKSNEMMSVDDVVSILSAELIGIIPEDTGIITSTNKGEPIVNNEKSLAGQAYFNVARRILGEDIPWLDIDQPKTIVGKIKKFFQKKVQG
ncbi:septum site-determining protein MinD [bacterium]|nr:septum site-determining protein MinD [bacterium]